MEKVKYIHEFETGKANGRENIDLESKDWIYRQKNTSMSMWKGVC